MYSRALNLHGMMISSNIFPKTVAMLHRVNLEPLVQKIYSLDEYEKAVDDMLSGKYIKGVFKCNNLE